MSFEKIHPKLNKDLSLPERIGITEKRVNELQAITDQLIDDSRDTGELILEIAGRDDLTALEKVYSAFALGMKFARTIDGSERYSGISRARLS